MSFTATPEQQKSRDIALTGRNSVIEAGAGTGKTSTLKLIASDRPNVKMLYIAYNKAIQLDAKATFPSNVQCRTSHSLAFGETGKRYADRCFKGPRVTGRQVASILDIDRSFPLGHDRELSTVAQARLVMDTVRNYCNSADADIMPRHTPMVAGAEEVSHDLALHLVRLANIAWADLLLDDSTGGGKLKFNPDHYLKIWALSKPRINAKVIFVDEAQDSNSCLMGVVLAQTHAQIIAVGDRSQAIYGWRGAVDAMGKFPAAPEDRSVLSQSFRFGPAVADVANQFLGKLDAPLRLSGFDKVASVVGPCEAPKAILCRTNAGVIQAALDTPAGQRYAIVGGGDAIEKFADAADALMNGKSAGWHADLGAFKSWKDVCEYADEGDGADLRVLVNLVRDYGVDELRRIARASVDEDKADRVISTAHKAKGREWDSVLIADDFTPSDERQELGMSREEMMLAYVAVTRAMKHLDPRGLAWALSTNDEMPLAV